jgi:glycosyltransferase involved in cell wall biosynthesis
VLLSDRVPPDHRGGAEVVAWRLALGLARAGHDVHLVAATEGRSREAHRDGLAVHLLHARYPARVQPWLEAWNPQTAGPLRRLYARLAPDVVHAHNVHNALSYASLTIARGLGLPVVATCHDLVPVCGGKLDAARFGRRPGVEAAMGIPASVERASHRFRYNPWRRTLARRALMGAATIRTAVSEAHRRMLAANGIDDVEVVSNGVDLTAPDVRSGETAPVLAGLPPQLVLVGGRLSRGKGVAALGPVMQALFRTRTDVGLLVLSRNPGDLALLGDGTARDPRVRHAGWLEGAALAAAYRAARVVAVPSVFFEPGSLMVLEAMAAARPVVASPYGGTPELVDDGVTGLLAHPDDTPAFAGTIAAILDDPARGARMGAAGRARVEASFSLERQVARCLDVYARAIAARRRRARVSSP